MPSSQKRATSGSSKHDSFMAFIMVPKLAALAHLQSTMLRKIPENSRSWYRILSKALFLNEFISSFNGIEPSWYFGGQICVSSLYGAR